MTVILVHRQLSILTLQTMTPLDLQPSAAASYARTLIAKGCPQHLAHAAADILANDGNRTAAEQAIVSRAWASITQ